jgi:hypothetical protein
MTVSGNLNVSGGFTLGDAFADTLSSWGPITGQYISGLSGYFGKVGIGTDDMHADTRLVVGGGGVLIGEGGALPLGALLAVSGDASITGELRVNRSGLFVGGSSTTDARVGIGTTNPDTEFHVVGSTAGWDWYNCNKLVYWRRQ